LLEVKPKDLFGFFARKRVLGAILNLFKSSKFQGKLIKKKQKVV
jgi:hypothetical protein